MTSWKESRKKFKNLEISMVYIAFFELFVITCSLHGTRAVAGKFSTFLWLSLFVATHRSNTFVGRVHPDGTRTSHALPLPPFALPCARTRGKQTPTQLTGRLEWVALTQAPFARSAGARTVLVTAY